jgi:hypothetical protein
MSNYKRLTERSGNGIAIKETSTNDYMSIWNAIERLAELEDKIVNGTLVFKEKPKTKYYAIVGYRNYCGQFGWHIHYVSIEYEKEHNQVALNIDGILYVTKKDLLFTTRPEAEAKLKELKGEV